ncbi:S-adenosylmethionine-dependent methyltransferase [Melia azedarach]|uniref:S-adenosylmethionine-dependent methyltransferase n=1 Tax=Melia azedarach TaxID=155640 RepID=A0ACC1XFB4_MELAZ|nr:S-adenosylmethionine-dependent methyltransferase [Melia azedarach]
MMLSVKSYPMNGGEGQYSYAKTSSFYQQGDLDITRHSYPKKSPKKLDVKLLCSSSNSFNIADLGCSVGPNTLFGIQNIIQSIELTSQFQGLNVQFQVFFNDHTSNDFNTLFKSLPPGRTYFAAGVPGTFYGRLFPENSLHFVHSSYAIHWLSKVPEEVADKNSAAWNKGRVVHGGSKEVEKVFSCQYENCMEKFLRARAMEIVCGGFMALPSSLQYQMEQILQKARWLQLLILWVLA